ncbi:phytanoyl-CoA dioxygenase family protein [Synechococcus sp. CCY 9618]|uniref:phytanoyl-CoA dioxygenase family protein n=1 Tax=Synechococcus sp. CCY 9618 TaxID=2815602 RepID=UPI001C217E5C|nr:phytanoyl-CoA dioxygenase family protein [Synechococcus sp. CCY 9618]
MAPATSQATSSAGTVASNLSSNLSTPLARNGYALIKGAIPAERIDALLDSLGRIKRSRRFRFRAQGTNSFEAPNLDGHGNLRNSIHNPHLLGALPGFQQKVEAIIFSEPLYRCLHDQAGEGVYVNWQTMLFDRSVGTRNHQDSWYLDTDPPGGVIGAWIALEDITMDCGPFKIYERTNRGRIDPGAYDFGDLENDRAFQCDHPEGRCVRLLPAKGDVILWDSLLVHGADMPASDVKTRKSLTAHFYRHGRAVQDQPIKRSFSIYDHRQPATSRHKKILKAATIHPLLYSGLCIGLSAIRSPELVGSGNALTEIRTVN